MTNPTIYGNISYLYVLESEFQAEYNSDSYIFSESGVHLVLFLPKSRQAYLVHY